jgi:hypothetical protein
MVLAQDQAQASQAEAIIAEQEYQQELVQYEKDLAQYEKDLVKYEKEKKKLAESQAAEAKRVADIKSTELKRKAAIESARIAEEKRVADIETARVAKLQSEAQARQTTWVNFWDSYTGNKGKAMKPVHYMSVGGVGFGTGDLVASIGGRGKIGIGAHSSYYERAATSLSSRYGVTVTAQQARQISATGARTMSGKAKEQVTRSIIDPSGKMESDYQASRAQAKKNVASAYGSMSAQEASTSSALATNPEAQNEAKLEVLHNLTSGLIGKKEETLQATSSDPVTAAQNAKQTQYVSELRQGNVGLATALLQPQTEQQYSTNTVNLRKFLSERGYDVSNPDTIPNVVLTQPVRYTDVRKQSRTTGVMGDLRELTPENPKISNTELQKRTEARERWESINIPVKQANYYSNPDKGSSFIGYGSDGSPIQGPPNISTESQWVVTDPNKTTPTSIPTMMGKSYIVQTPVTYTFDTKEQAQGYIDYENKINYLTHMTDQNYSTPGNNPGQWMADYYRKIDDTGKYWQSDKGIGGTYYRETPIGWIAGAGIGIQKMAVGLAIQVDNLATQHIAPYVSGTLPPTPLIQSSESSDQTVFPYDFENWRFKTGEEITTASSEYIEKYGTPDFVGGIVGGYWIGGKGAKQLIRPLGIGSQPIYLPITAKTLTGEAVKEAVPVAKEFKLFGKTIATKTYDNPTTISSVEKLKLADTSGSYSWGKPNTAKVLAKVEITPQGTGLELMTGVKQQTQFNKAVVQELVKQGKMSPGDAKFVEDIERGVQLSRKEKPIMYSGFGEKPLKFIPIGPITQAILRGIGKAQSPINYIRLKTRLGQVGGSMAQDIQLKPKYQKGAKHDIDIDAPKTDDAIRHTKTIYDEVVPHSTKDTKIGLASNEKKITVTSKETGGKPDEFVELLDKTDAVKYQSAAQESGKRFGVKYRIDKLSKVFMQPLKESDSGIKVRDIRDQILAKASSVISLQGKTSGKFKGAAEAGTWEAKQNKLIDDGALHIDPPTHRGKDTVDLYKIFKSRAEELSESISPIKKAEGKELDKIAENIKSRSPELDFTQKSGEVTSYVIPEKSVSSLASDSLKSYSNTPTLVPTTIPTTSPVEDGQILYHGTNTEAAENIIKYGFRLSKSETSGWENIAAKTIFTNTDVRGVAGYNKGSLLKITMQKEAKEFDVNKQPNPLEDDDVLRLAAKDEKADTITNIMQSQQPFGAEVELVSTKNIKSIETVQGDVRGKWTPNNTIINKPTTSTISPTPSIFSKTQSLSSISKPSILSTSKPSILSTSKPSILSTSKSSISSTSKSTTSKSTTSKSTPSKSVLSKSTPSKSRLSRASRLSKPSRSSRLSRASKSSRLSRTSKINRNPSSVLPTRKPIIPIIYDFESTYKKEKSKNKKTVDFLGNTRTDHIVGLFKRKEIISGDKASAKQLKRDKEWKTGKKKRRNVKNRSKSFGQRIGIINKGFKI